jgi:hypothetical protein
MFRGIFSILPKLNRRSETTPLPFANKLIHLRFAAESLVNGSAETTAMIRTEDIGSLTDFSRNTKAHLKRLRRSGRPELLTVNGKAEVVVQSAPAYQRLLNLLEKLKRGAQRKI